jgi:LPXTG-site transpeptidase (sortase) family protein
MAADPSSLAGHESAPTEEKYPSGVLMAGAVAVLVLVMSLMGGNDTTTYAPRPPQAAPAGSAAPSAEEPSGAPGKRLPRSKPVRLLIPKISVDAPFTELSITPSGQLEAPPAGDINLVGWHAEGPSPGEIGTSVIAGHLDTKTSPAVFAGLSELSKGDVFHVRRADGRKASFVVDDVETFEKDKFPDERVYGDTGQAEVRLITCAGAYDTAVKDYTENLVVFAHLT